VRHEGKNLHRFCDVFHAKNRSLATIFFFLSSVAFNVDQSPTDDTILNPLILAACPLGCRANLRFSLSKSDGRWARSSHRRRRTSRRRLPRTRPPPPQTAATTAQKQRDGRSLRRRSEPCESRDRVWGGGIRVRAHGFTLCPANVHDRQLGSQIRGTFLM
jgi:hypothetical protein